FPAIVRRFEPYLLGFTELFVFQQIVVQESQATRLLSRLDHGDISRMFRAIQGEGDGAIAGNRKRTTGIGPIKVRAADVPRQNYGKFLHWQIADVGNSQRIELKENPLAILAPDGIQNIALERHRPRLQEEFRHLVTLAFVFESDI